MRTQYVTKLEGTPHQYYLLKIWQDGEEYPLIHSSKSMAYLKKIEKRYKFLEKGRS